jgi:hypothetical protein
MGMTSAQKQARFRERHLVEGDQQRLQLVVSLQTKLGLARLARHHRLTQTDLIERLVRDELGRVTGAMDDAQYRVFVGE